MPLGINPSRAIYKSTIIAIFGWPVFNKLVHGKFPWLDKALPVISMVGIAIIITVITAAGRVDLLSIGLILITVVFVHNISGYT